MTNFKVDLIEYGKTLLRSVTLGDGSQEPAWAMPFMRLLRDDYAGQVAPAHPLRAIPTFVEMDGQTATPAFVSPFPLGKGVWPGTSEWQLFPRPESDVQSRTRPELWAEFVQAGGEQEQDFDRFFALMQAFASTLPNVYGEAGVSLFQQWKLIAALVCIAGGTNQPPAALGLVGGDIPGIQRTINLVTSKGAAKAMRGRSAFIQLLGHALVARLIDDLHLSQANVVYDAGGNFVLLSGWSDDLSQKVSEIALEVNRVLLAGAEMAAGRFDGFRGDLSAALAVVPMPSEALHIPTAGRASTWQATEKALKDAVAAAKARPFGDLALQNADGWDLLFGTEGTETDEFCAVCRRQPRPGEKFEELRDAVQDISIGSNSICPECRGFNLLADGLGHGGGRLLMSRRQPQTVDAWQRCLYAVSGGWWYGIGKPHERGEITLALALDGFPAAGVDGLRLMANTTPMNERTIKPNDELAEASESGMKRLGVLRMDVDDLGMIFVRGLPNRTLTQTSEISHYLERFFSGWLQHICAGIDGGKGWFYVLFAGGDDLFIVGPWTAMPTLARAIYDNFRRYTGNHPAIHLSAGIAIVPEKAPLHTAAEEAHEALEAAKRLESKRGVSPKDAITFLGVSYRWHDFAQVEAFKDQLVYLVGEDGKHLPRGLLTTLMSIAHHWRKDQEINKGAKGVRGARDSYELFDGRRVELYYGPWMWKQAYALHRMGEQRKVPTEMKELNDNLLAGRIQDLGLAARWAQWLTRADKRED